MLPRRLRLALKRLLPSNVRRLIFASVTVVLFTWSYKTILYDSVEPYGLNIWFSLRGPVEPPDDIILVSMDDAGFERLGVTQYEIWPRKLLAEFVDRARELGAKHIIFDLFFKEDRNPENDQKLRDAIASMPVSIVGVVETRKNSRGESEQYIVRPNPLFSSVSKKVGGANLPIDLNILQQPKIVRRFSYTFERSVPPLYLLPFTDTELDKGPGPKDFINYYGPSGSVRSMPLFDFIDNNVSRDQVEGKTLIVGHVLKYRKSKDTFDTPLVGWPSLGEEARGGVLHGVEIHVTQALNMIDKKWIRRMNPKAERYVSTCALGLFVIMPLFAFARNISVTAFITKRLILVVFLLCVWCYFSYLRFLQNVYLPYFSVVTLGLPAFAIPSAVYTYLENRRFKQSMKGFLGDAIPEE